MRSRMGKDPETLAKACHLNTRGPLAGHKRMPLTRPTETIGRLGVTRPRAKHPNIAAPCVYLQSNLLIRRSNRGVDIVKANCIPKNDRVTISLTQSIAFKYRCLHSDNSGNLSGCMNNRQLAG